MNESFIAIDWGSTNLRAWLYKQGLCMDSLNSESGVTRLQGQTPQQVFSRLMQPWFQEYGELPTLMAGMVGSNAGWQAVPYLPCPVSLGEIAHILPLSTHRICPASTLFRGYASIALTMPT